MARFADIPIQDKVTSIILLTSCVAILISSGVFITGDTIFSRRELVRELSTVAEITGHNSAAAVLFDGCRVPAANRLGEEGGGVEVARQRPGSGRLTVSARSMGGARD